MIGLFFFLLYWLFFEYEAGGNINVAHLDVHLRTSVIGIPVVHNISTADVVPEATFTLAAVDTVVREAGAVGVATNAAAISGALFPTAVSTDVVAAVGQPISFAEPVLLNSTTREVIDVVQRRLRWFQ